MKRGPAIKGGQGRPTPSVLTDAECCLVVCSVLLAVLLVAVFARVLA